MVAWSGSPCRSDAGSPTRRRLRSAGAASGPTPYNLRSTGLIAIPFHLARPRVYGAWPLCTRGPRPAPHTRGRHRGQPHTVSVNIGLIASPATTPHLFVLRPRPDAVDILDLLRGFAERLLGQRRRHEFVEVAVKHAAGVGGGDAGAQILHHLVGLQHVGADLVAPADVGLGGLLGDRPPLRGA